MTAPELAVGVDPAAPRPPIGFRLDVPDEFTALDLDPATSDAYIEALLDERSANVPGAARQRSRARQLLQRIVGEHREAGVFLASFLVGTGASPGEDVELREVRRLEHPYGETVRVVNRQQVPVPLTSRRQEVVVVQHMVPAPAPAEEWLAVLTFSTPDVAGQGEFVELTGRIAASLEFLAEDGTTLPPPGPPTGTIGFVPT